MLSWNMDAFHPLVVVSFFLLLFFSFIVFFFIGEIERLPCGKGDFKS